MLDERQGSIHNENETVWGLGQKGGRCALHACAAPPVGFQEIPQALLVLAAVLGVMAAVVGLARRYWGGAGEDRVGPRDLLRKFRELHGKGVLSDEEFRTISTKLTNRFQDELRDIDEKG
jgi:hypothetical protein